MSYHEWLPEDHRVHFLSEILDQLDLSPVTRIYENGGPVSLPYDPRMVVKLLLYAYALGIFSSREIARQCVENVAFRVLMESNIPDFRAISDFRQRHVSELRVVFHQALRCYQNIGLEKLGSLALKEARTPVRASKPRAKGSRRKPTGARSLDVQVKELLARAEETDAAEDLEYGPAQRGEEVPTALAGRESRLQTICTALAALGVEVAGVAPKPVAPTAQSHKTKHPSERLAGEESTNGQEDVTDPKTSVMEEPAEASFTAETAQPAAPTSEHIAREEVSIAQSAVASDALSPAEAVGENDGLTPDQALAEFDSWIEPTARVAERDAPVQGAVEVEPEERMVPPSNGQDAAGVRQLLPTPTPITRAFRDRAFRVRMPEQSIVLLQLRETKLIDLSVSGALVEHTIPIRIGNLYRLSIPVEGHQIQVWARATRAYASHFVSSNDGEKLVVYRTGMAFVRLEKDTTERLSTYVDRLLAEGRGVE